ncbi:MAG: hypothetical protein QOH84_315 [Kribbellaceae bacterium]|nr:hypothetical protein [Kribbellaceae bacterium]
MTDLQAIADLLDLQALQATFTDAAMTRDWEFFVQTIHPGALTIAGDTATGRTYIEEFGRFAASTFFDLPSSTSSL